MNIKSNKMNKTFSIKNNKKTISSLIFWVAFFLFILLITIFAINNSQETDFDQNNFKILETDFIKEEYDNFPIRMYPLFITSGMIVAVIFTILRFNKKNMDYMYLSIGICFIIPISLLGASFFGKINFKESYSFQELINLFAFWKGGMAIHGGVFSGFIVALIYFYIIGKKITKVSLSAYADAILPNILIAQSIGRWGNFFNHELVGNPIYNYGPKGEISGSGLWWIPNFILENTSAKYTGHSGLRLSSIDGVINKDDIVQMSPIFLYESLLLLFGWLIIMFVAPSIIKLINKKPWKIDPEKYSYTLKSTFIQMIKPWTKTKSPELSLKDSWRKAFDYSLTQEHQQKDNLKLVPKSYIKNAKTIDSINNPYDFTIIRSGVEGAAYFFIWNFVRFFLELQRPNSDLFIIDDRAWSLGIIIMSFMSGLIFMLFFQFGMPKLYRQPNWTYEKLLKV